MSDITNLIRTISDTGIYKVTQAPHDVVQHFVHDILGIKARNLSIEVAAEGFGGAYLVTRGIQLFSKHVVNKFVPEFYEKVLPWFEGACIVGIPAAVLGYGIVDFEGLQEMIYSKPMDNWGITWAYAGGLTGVVHDYINRIRHKSKDKKRV